MLQGASLMTEVFAWRIRQGASTAPSTLKAGLEGEKFLRRRRDTGAVGPFYAKTSARLLSPRRWRLVGAVKVGAPHSSSRFF